MIVSIKNAKVQVTDGRTYHHHHQKKKIANIQLVYVGLAQARPNNNHLNAAI